MTGRRFRVDRRVHLGDASSRGRLRLDALAAYLQDVAADDAEDAHLPEGRGWVLRRTALHVDRLPAIYEPVELETWCSGVGRRWAERRTTLTANLGVGVRGVSVEATAVWVYVSLETGAPEPLPPEFFAVYGESADNRKVSVRLSHDEPPASAARMAWPLRSTDFDVFGHVNNCVYWVAVEDVLAARAPAARITAAEIEFRGGIDPGERPELVVVDGENSFAVWFQVGGQTRASGRVSLA
ncbi:MAG: hypothetical protein FJW88_03440 [Actinobacteria bacterium]|nr:hypothetical protein [Actinomycetota bacterium]